MATERERLLERIVVDPQILVGKPVVRGTRIAVALILRHLAHNVDVQDVLAAYPRLTVEDIQACLEYAAALVADEDVFPAKAEVHGPVRAG